jgi:hypothetical protein
MHYGGTKPHDIDITPSPTRIITLSSASWTCSEITQLFI